MLRAGTEVGQPSLTAIGFCKVSIMQEEKGKGLETCESVIIMMHQEIYVE